MGQTRRDVTTGGAATALALLLAVVLVITGSAVAQEDADGEESIAEETEIVADTSDTIAVAKVEGELGNADIAVRLSEVTVPDDGAQRVLIGRDDEFADAMSSAVMQGDAPLLLVPQQLPLPDSVVAEIARLGATDAVLLGGTAALPDEIADALRGLGLTVQRREGPSRFETAIDIAVQDAGPVDTAILARAFPAEDATDPTQAFADSIAAGGMSAVSGWPILLTQTDVLTAPTRSYLQQAGITTVLIVGGTAAVSAGVAGELAEMGLGVERIAGESRAGTAVAIAEKRGAPSAADVARSVLVDGFDPQAWASGFAAAHHSAVFDAPIVLSSGASLPPETAEWLGTIGDGATTGSTVPVLTCTSSPTACEQARTTLRLPPPLRMAVAPAERSEIRPGHAIGLRVEGEDLADVGVRVTGDCVVAASGPLQEDGRSMTTVATDAAPGPCRVTWQVARPGGTVHSATAAYLVPDREEEALHAAFAMAPRQPVAGSPVSFTDRSTGEVERWQWSFGDGSTSDQQNPGHTYREPGEYRVVLEVIDAERQTSTVGRLITVLEEGTLAADFSFSPRSPTAGQAVSFTDRSSGEVVGWEWNFGDGSTSTVQNPRHTYREAGDHRVGLRVTDRSGATATATRVVSVAGEEVLGPLVADFSFSPTAPEVGDSVSFTDRSTGEVVGWEWNFGDGSVVVTSQNPSHTYRSAGEFRVGLRVTDRAGATSRTTATVTVVDPGSLTPPRAGFDFTVDGCGVTFTDVSREGSAPIDQWSWHFGDRSGTSAAQNPRYTYTASREYDVRLQVTASDGGTHAVTRTVRVDRC